MRDSVLAFATYEEIEEELRRRYPAVVVGAAFPHGQTNDAGDNYDFCIHGDRILCAGLLSEMGRCLTAKAFAEEIKDEED